jgi:hypothetical protein
LDASAGRRKSLGDEKKKRSSKVSPVKAFGKKNGRNSGGPGLELALHKSQLRPSTRARSRAEPSVPEKKLQKVMQHASQLVHAAHAFSGTHSPLPLPASNGFMIDTKQSQKQPQSARLDLQQQSIPPFGANPAPMMTTSVSLPSLKLKEQTTLMERLERFASSSKSKKASRQAVTAGSITRGGKKGLTDPSSAVPRTATRQDTTGIRVPTADAIPVRLSTGL